VGDPAYVAEVLRKRTSPTRVWVYLLQSQETLEGCYVEVLNAKADRIFATSREWRGLQRQQGITKPIDVLPPIPLLPTGTITREKGRVRLHIPEDTTILLSMNRNAAHKRYDLLIQAFVELLLKHPQKPLFLMCVCDKGPNQEHALDEQTPQSEQTGGYHPLFDLFARELKQKGASVADYSSRLMLSTQYDSLSDEERSLFYSIADVGVSCADGGATDLCVLDGMAHGLPHVVSHIVAHQGLCTADNSIRVEPVTRIQCGSQERRLVSASAVAQALETYVTNETLRKAHGAVATTVASTNSLLKRLDLFRQERDIDLAP
jgi:glycosyltransferase involved in cell wall biosynthesis